MTLYSCMQYLVYNFVVTRPDCTRMYDKLDRLKADVGYSYHCLIGCYSMIWYTCDLLLFMIYLAPLPLKSPHMSTMTLQINSNLTVFSTTCSSNNKAHIKVPHCEPLGGGGGWVGWVGVGWGLGGVGGGGGGGWGVGWWWWWGVHWWPSGYMAQMAHARNMESVSMSWYYHAHLKLLLQELLLSAACLLLMYKCGVASWQLCAEGLGNLAAGTAHNRAIIAGGFNVIATILDP